MDNIYCKNIKIPASRAGYDGTLTVDGLASEFLDIAGEHANHLGCGIADIDKAGLFWLTVKTRLEISRLPALGEETQLYTWPEAPEKYRGNRDYRLKAGNEVLAEGKTEWAIMNLQTGRFALPADVYPEGLEICDDLTCPAPFLKMSGAFDCEPFAVTTIKSTDIDLGRHMNNVAYIRAIMSLFSSTQLREMNIRAFEIDYKSQCREGEEIVWKRRDEENMIWLKGECGGKTAVLAVIECGIRNAECGIK